MGLRLVTTRWREQFFFAWSVSTVVFIGTAAAIDGGTHSPLSYLLVPFPLMFAALAYSPRYVTWLALLAVACAAAIGSSTPHPQAAATLIMVLATAIAGVLTVGGASNRAQLTSQLVEMAALDSMTGCLRGAFNRRLSEEVDRARRYGRTFGLVMVDVDNLKRLNDTAGHKAGDEALRSVAFGLRAAARASDVVGRLGGDEFAVLLPETDASDVETVLERLRSVRYGELDPRPRHAQPGVHRVVGPSRLSRGDVLPGRRRPLRGKVQGAPGRSPGSLPPCTCETLCPKRARRVLISRARAAMNLSKAGT